MGHFHQCAFLRGELHGFPAGVWLRSVRRTTRRNSNNQSRQATGAAASNLDLYQVNCTFFDAMGRNESAYLVARAIQFFVPGIPQVYYVGLLAGENDMDLLTRTKVGRDINRHYYSREEVLAAERGVVLFVDTFNGYFESDNAHAALRVLQAAGYTVHVASKQQPDGKHLCCGRTYLASGMVEQAKDKAREVVASLLPFAQKGMAIVGLEPSCLLTLRDEMLVLGLGDAPQLIARHALMFEEFLAREAQAGRLDALKSKIRPVDKPVLLHGHCHQKAFDAVSPVMEVLRWIPGANPTLIESSCCGMAGSFGYEASHHDVSMQMAELSLLPAVRAQPDAIVVADGTSCRHQIADGSQRKAVHVSRLLADLLVG